MNQEKAPLLPYGNILLVAVVWLTVRHIRDAGPSARSKKIVGGLCACLVLSQFLGLIHPRLNIVFGFIHPLVFTLLMVGICVYLIVHQMVQSVNREHAEGSQLPASSHTNKPIEPKLTDRKE